MSIDKPILSNLYKTIMDNKVMAIELITIEHLCWNHIL